MVEIINGIEIIDLALYLKKQKILVIADVHIGYEEALNKEGILVPRFQFKEIIKRLENIFSEVKPNFVIINGDLKHEFGTISEQEWRDTLKLLDFLVKNGKKVILIKGNHDTIIGPIAKKRNVDIKDYYLVDDIYITHGDKIPLNDDFKKSKTVIIGHTHPAVSIRSDVRAEKFKCFIKGKWKKKTLIVMPSLNLVTEGSDIQQEKLLSPFLQQNLNDFEIYVLGDKIYNFGKLRNIN